jgi:hypothetical protein
MLGWTVLNQLKLDPPRATFRCRSSRWRRSASTAWRAAPSPTSSSRHHRGLEAAFDRIKEFTAPRTKRLLVVEDNEIERSDRRAARHDDIEIERRHRRGGARKRCTTGASIAWCSICGCRT